MIERYARPAMTALWSPQHKFRLWYEIEAAATQALADLGQVPASAAEAVWAVAEHFRSGQIDVAAIDAIEAETRHDVIAFLTYLAEQVGPESRFVHQGMTSSDVLDTAFSMQLRDASDLLLESLSALLAVLKRRAFEHKETLSVGRSHGIHAEPTTFGLKLAGHYAIFQRCQRRLEVARAEIASCALSGAVGTSASLDPEVQDRVAEALGLASEPHSTQVIARDRHAAFFTTLAVIASAVENLAVEIRHLQRSEVLEAEEHFAAGQKGSSAMPHKRNPVLSENLTGLARLVRAYALPALENVALWHERDISHSSVERVIGPDATVTLDFALARLTGVIDKLQIYPEKMRENLDQLHGLIHSQRVLLALTQKGVSREAAYRLVQRSAMRSWAEDTDFFDLLVADEEVMASLSEEELRNCFDIAHYTAQIDRLFARVFG